MKKFALLISATTLAGAAFAGELFDLKSASEFRSNAKITQNGELFTVKGAKASMHTKATFAVDPAKVYELSAEFRVVSGKAPKVFLALVPLTEAGKVIPPSSVIPAVKSETELAVAAKIGDKVLKVKNGSAWNLKRKNCSVAFDVKEKYADLPNFNTVAMADGAVKQEGDQWVVTLKKPLTKNYAAGTKVRQHFSGSSYIYAIVKPATSKLAEYSAKITGSNAFGTGNRKFVPGTKKVRVAFYYIGGDKDTVLEFKDINFEVEK